MTEARPQDPCGLISSVFDFLTYGVLISGFHAGEALLQTYWFMISLLTEPPAVFTLGTRRSALWSLPRRQLLWSPVAVAAVA